MAEHYESEAFIYNQVPVRIFNHCFDGTDIFTGLHWHRNIEFNLTTKGRIKMNIDGTTIPLPAGQWCIVNSGELHSNHWVEPTDHFEGICVQISKSFMDRWVGEGKRFALPGSKTASDRIKEMIIRFGEYQKKGVDDLKKMELVFSLLNLLRDNCVYEVRTGEKVSEDGDSNIKAIINYIDEHYMEQIDLSTVAAHFNYTPTYLSRMFKEHVGRNFYQYLQNVRLMNCVEEMRDDDNTRLMDCALNHGFPNAKSFIQTFKKTFGCTPSEWMKQGKKAELLPQ
ncbi:MAG: helix-turn-helix transcriptional regulator [Butyrivibrio sp.]|nr:helix-turn-helix transcriptional regulator [Butyrivibrio sp.]